jgi:hypothetical protein
MRQADQVPGLACGRAGAYELRSVTGLCASALAVSGTAEGVAAERSAARRGAPHSPRFALAKSRPTTLPTTLLARSALFGRLMAGAGKHLTAVGSAGAGFALGQDRPQVSLAEDQHLAGHLGPGCEHEGRRTTGQDQPAAAERRSDRAGEGTGPIIVSYG